MENKSSNINLHQMKLYALICGGAALLGMILPWAVISGFGGFGGGSSSNGFGGWGFLSLLGIVGVVVASLFGDKLQGYDKNMKIVAMSSFGAIILGAFIAFMQVSGAGNRMGGFGGVKVGIGIFLTILAGAAGLLLVAGIIKIPPKKPTDSNTSK
ncbi:MAG TPA: hypothetical protein PKC72_10185 [Chitinophagaceae bacterium]|nr:hypothetical protein [Chitinophagaceae bacterium]